MTIWKPFEDRASLPTIRIDSEQATRIIQIEEGQFADVKSIEIGRDKLSRHISAFANADGGDLYIGISEGPTKSSSDRVWKGFESEEHANSHLQIFEQHFPLGVDFQYEFLSSEAHPGKILHVLVNKTRGVIRATNNIPYIRRGSQSLPCDTPEKIKHLEYAKGIATFEDETTNSPEDTVTQSEVVEGFVQRVIPRSTPQTWLRKQLLIRHDRPTVAGVLLFSDEPQAQLPKHCGVKIYRYKTTESVGFREALDSDPETIEGALYNQIQNSVARTTELIQRMQRMGEKGLESITYPPETLHEIITNAVLHRDYSIADDIHIRIFDNRIEVQSPGKLPAHITIDNILDERFARNGAVVRILNKFPNPPNKDVGEGLNTAFDAMNNLGLKEPIIKESGNSVLVIIRHETLASPEETIMDYLATHDIIQNKDARKITHIQADYKIKMIFGRMVEAGMIEQVPGTRTASTAYRKARPIFTDRSNNIA